MPVHKHDGTWMGPNPPVKKGPMPITKYETSGKDAGGTDNMKADGHKHRADVKAAPTSGSKHWPSSVKVGDGKSTPGSVAKSPK